MGELLRWLPLWLIYGTVAALYIHKRCGLRTSTLLLCLVNGPFSWLGVLMTELGWFDNPRA